MFANLEKKFLEKRYCCNCRCTFTLLDNIGNYNCESHIESMISGNEKKVYRCCLNELPCRKSIHTTSCSEISRDEFYIVPIYIINIHHIKIKKEFKEKYVMDFVMLDDKKNPTTDQSKMNEYYSYLKIKCHD